MLAQEGPEGVEHAVYYLSKKFLPYEEKYNLVEKICLIMIWATRKLRHYFQSYKIQAVSKIDPLKYLFQVLALTGKMSRWLVLLTEFDIQYITTKVIKGRAVAEFLALNAVEGEEQWNLEFSNKPSHIFLYLRHWHFLNGFDLVRIYFYPSYADYMP